MSCNSIEMGLMNSLASFLTSVSKASMVSGFLLFGVICAGCVGGANDLRIDVLNLSDSIFNATVRVLYIQNGEDVINKTAQVSILAPLGSQSVYKNSAMPSGQGDLRVIASLENGTIMTYSRPNWQNNPVELVSLTIRNERAYFSEGFRD